MGAAGKVALISFIENLPTGSALKQALNPEDEYRAWYETIKTNAILADIFDVLVAVNTKKGRTPISYPRPQEHQVIGRGAIPISEFWDWWNGGQDG